MTDPTAIPPDPIPPKGFPIADLLSDSFQFDTTSWYDPPAFTSTNPNGMEDVARRNANQHVYRQTGSATTWNRYLTLAFYTLDDAANFDREWSNMATNPLTIHRMIWYNYLYHVDHELTIPPKLHSWATLISQPYLIAHDPGSLVMNTTHKSWAELQIQPESMELDDTQQGEWIPVQPRGRSRDRTPPKCPPIPEHPTGASNIIALNTDDNNNHDLPTILPTTATDSRPPFDDQMNIDTTITDPSDTAQPFDPAYQGNSFIPRVTDWTSDSGDDATNPTTLLDDGPRPPAITHVPTNDGTHRVIIKWKLDKQSGEDSNTLGNNKALLDQAIHRLLKHIFNDDDGTFYRWESEDLIQAQTISQTTPSSIRDFLTPVITTIHSRNMIIFGARFCFNTNPAKWKSPTKLELLKQANLSVTLSNSISTSGKLVIAGYILLKAPNSTHRHRYTQHLIRQLPDNTPYFDLIRLAKSPLDHAIPHLAIQCGEKHVVPLCQALSNYLTGKNRALFIPRYSLGATTEDKIAKRFEFHKTWSRSMVSVPLAPLVSHIDQPRREYCRDGTVIIRSAREWTETLLMPNGTTHVLCDIVNGTADRKTHLLVPRHYLDEAKTQVQAYKLRLSPPSRREARYRDALPGLPTEIQISSLVETNFNFIDEMSAADIWSNAPASVKQKQRKDNNPGTAKGSKSVNQQRSMHRRSLFLHNSIDSSNDTDFPELASGNTANETDKQSRSSDRSSRGKSDTPPARRLTSDDDRSNVSQSLTRGSGSMTTDQARFRETDAMIKRQQTNLEAHVKKTSDRMETIERQFLRFNQLETQIENIHSKVTQATQEQQATTHGLRDDIQAYTIQIQEQHATYQQQCDTQIANLEDKVLLLVNGMLKMRKEVAKLSKIMAQAMTSQPSPGPRRRKQRTQPSQENMFSNLLPGVTLEDMMIDSDDDDSTLDQQSARAFSDPDFPNGRVNLNDRFQAQEDHSNSRSRLEPLHRQHSGNSSTTLAAASASPLPLSPSQATSVDAPESPSTNVSNQLSQTQINTFFQPAPLNPRNNKKPGSAGAHIK